MTTPPPTLRQVIAAEASALGFHDCRIAPAARGRHAEGFLAWIAEGRHATMEWLARNPERRVDPQQVLPGARSIIVLGTNYFVEAQPAARGRFARYAWGDDDP